MSDNQGITPPHLQGFGSPSAGATRMSNTSKDKEHRVAYKLLYREGMYGDWSEIIVTADTYTDAIKEARRRLPEEKGYQVMRDGSRYDSSYHFELKECIDLEYQRSLPDETNIAIDASTSVVGRKVKL